MDVSVGHLGATWAYATYQPGENLAVDAARAERLAPATTPRDYRLPPSDEAAHLPELAVVTPYGESCACPPEPRAESSPGFPRLAMHEHATAASPETIVIERPVQVPIYPPATLGVMIDVFA
ncbi:MAG: hypothetical protein AAGF84_09330 [Planctomycetota bacterium]